MKSKTSEWKQLSIEMIENEEDEFKQRTICRLVAAVVGEQKERGKQRVGIDKPKRK